MVKLTRPFYSETASGKLDDVVYNTRNKRAFARKAPPTKAAPPTAAQIINQNKYADITYLFQIMRRLTCRINGVGYTPYELFLATSPPAINPFAEWHKRARTYNDVLQTLRNMGMGIVEQPIQNAFNAIATRDQIAAYNFRARFYAIQENPFFLIITVLFLAEGERGDILSPPIDYHLFRVSDDPINPPLI